MLLDQLISFIQKVRMTFRNKGKQRIAMKTTERYSKAVNDTLSRQFATSTKNNSIKQ